MPFCFFFSCKYRFKLFGIWSSVYSALICLFVYTLFLVKRVSFRSKTLPVWRAETGDEGKEWSDVKVNGHWLIVSVTLNADKCITSTIHIQYQVVKVSLWAIIMCFKCDSTVFPATILQSTEHTLMGRVINFHWIVLWQRLGEETALFHESEDRKQARKFIWGKI